MKTTMLTVAAAALMAVPTGTIHAQEAKGDQPASWIHVRVDESGEERIRVVMPPEVADALLDGEGERLDLRAALRQLARTGDRELVRVRDDDATVRVWVDDSSGQGEEAPSR